MSQIKWMRVSALMPSVAMAFMDQSILPVALPTIQKELGASTTELQWTINSYLLSLTLFILIGGKISDRIGSRTAYLWGIGLFAFFSAVCGLSPNVPFLAVARAFQGCGAALMFPAQSALISKSFPISIRGRVAGLIVSMSSIFLILGPLIGGFLTQVASWRWIFWINLPISVVGIILVFKWLPKIESHATRLDLKGFIYFVFFATAATVLFMQAQDWGFDSLATFAVAFLTLISLILLIYQEKSAKFSFLELDLFKYRIFKAIAVNVSITQFILMISVFRTIYTEEILGFSPYQTGLIISGSSLPVLFFSYIAGFLSDKMSPKLPIFIGYFSMGLSFFWLGLFPTPSLISYLFALVLFGLGIPLIFTPSYSGTMSLIKPEKMGAAFGLLNTIRQFAGTMGLALIHLFVTTEASIKVREIGRIQSQIFAFSSIHYLLGVLIVLCFATVFYFYQGKSKHQEPASPAEGWD